MLIAQISDTHILAADSGEPAADIRADNLAHCVAAINRLQPDVVVCTGDTVQNGQPQEYARLRELLAPLRCPIYLIPGNRDANDALRRAFADFAYLPDGGEPLCYAIDDYPLRLIGLDSTADGQRKGFFGVERQEWLARTLAEQPDRPTLLFIHHPPFDVGDHYVGGYANSDDSTALAEIVNHNRQVVRLLCGHVHWPVHTCWAGTQSSIMPSVAVDVRKGVEETAAQGRPVFLLHQYAPGKGIVSQQVFAGR